MKYAALVGAIAFAFCSGICGAEEPGDENAPAALVITQEGTAFDDTSTGAERERPDFGNDKDEPVEVIKYETAQIFVSKLKKST